MPILASARSGLPGIAGGERGFSRKSTIFHDSSTAMTPKSEASASGTSTQATMQSAPLACMSASMFE